jgi:predicted transcriptional regulator
VTTSLRVSEATRARVAALAAASGQSIGEVVDEALDAYERARFWEQTRRALEARSRDADLPEDEAARAWDRTVRDGLDRR